MSVIGGVVVLFSLETSVFFKKMYVYAVVSTCTACFNVDMCICFLVVGAFALLLQWFMPCYLSMLGRGDRKNKKNFHIIGL